MRVLIASIISIAVAAAVAASATATTSSSHVAALIGNDRVTANYPGFHRTPGDITALAVNSSVTRWYGEGDASASMGDAIVIRKVATLSAHETRHFNINDAIRLAFLSEHLSAFQSATSAAAISNQRTFVACGREAFGFTRVQSFSLLTAEKPLKFTELDVYAFQVVNNDVWEADYSRLFDPGIDRQGKSLIAFTSNFCVQQDYKKK